LSADQTLRLQPSFEDDLLTFHEALAKLPLSHPRVLGWWLLRLGMAVMLPFLCTGPAGPNICLGIAAFGCALARPPIFHLPGLSWALAFYAWVGISAICSGISGFVPHPMRGLGLAYTWVALYMSMIAFSHQPTLRITLRILSIVVIASAMLALAQFIIGLGERGPLRIDPHGKRFEHGVGFMALHLSQGPVMAYFMLLMMAAKQSALLPAGSAISGMLAAGAAVFLSTARMAYLGLAAGLAAAVASRGRIYFMRALIAFLIVAGSAVAILSYWQPLRTARALHGDDGRWIIWRTSLAIIRAHPLIGAGGPEGYKAEYNWRFSAEMPAEKNEFILGGAPHAHNSLLSIAAEHGLPAVVLYLGFIISVLMACFRRRHESAVCWRLGLALSLACLAAGMFENIAGHSVPAYAFFVTLGIAVMLPKDVRTNHSMTA